MLKYIKKEEKKMYTPLYKAYYSDKQEYEMLYDSRFHNELATHFDFTIGEYSAFFLYVPEMVDLLDKIWKENTQIEIIYNQLPAIAGKNYLRKILIDEAKQTNDIENVYSTRKELEERLEEVSQPNYRSKLDKRFEGLVNKYLMLMKGNDIPLSTCQDIRNIFDELVSTEIKKDNPNNLPDGQIFRKDGVDVTAASGTQKVIHRGLHPEAKIIEYVSKGISLLQNVNINPFVRISIFHYLFGYIHPFYDGNGRVNRFISSYLLSKELHISVALALSGAIKKNLNAYYDAFKKTNDFKNKGDLTPFILYFFDVIWQATLDIREEVTKGYDKWMFYSKKAIVLEKKKGIKDQILYILLQNTLFGIRGISISEIAQIFERSVPSVRNQLDKIGKEYFLLSKQGHTILYEVNLDKLSQTEETI